MKNDEMISSFFNIKPLYGLYTLSLVSCKVCNCGVRRPSRVERKDRNDGALDKYTQTLIRHKVLYLCVFPSELRRRTVRTPQSESREKSAEIVL